jgi:regulator of sigma E protease
MAWLAPVLVLGVVIAVHEAGHFWAAKAFGVYAPRFSIGFGRALWRRRWGETEYVIGWLPLGGYVRMASRLDEEAALLEGGAEESASPETVKDWDPQAMKPFGPHPVPEHRWFESKPLWQRLVIMSAGVAMNGVLALVMSIALFAVWGRPYQRPVLGELLPDRPAAMAGLASGDTVLAVDGTPVQRWDDVVERVQPAIGTPLLLTIGRAGGRREVAVTPQADTGRDAAGNPATVGRIGAFVARDAVGRDAVPLPQAVVEGARATGRMTVGIVDVVGGLLTGRVSVSSLGGPVAIANASVQAARSGVESVVTLIAFLSVNLGVLNLLPIPVLDGGQILLNIAESVKGRPFSAGTRDWLTRVSLAALLLLFSVVMWNDVAGLFRG